MELTMRLENTALALLWDSHNHLDMTFDTSRLLFAPNRRVPSSPGLKDRVTKHWLAQKVGAVGKNREGRQVSENTSTGTTENHPC